MKTVELRKKLIEEINLSSNKTLLEEMYNFLNQDNEIDIYQLSTEQIDAINEGREQIKKEQFFSDDQVNNEIDEWLKDK